VRGERAAREEKGNLLYLEQRFSGIAAQTLHHKNIIRFAPRADNCAEEMMENVALMNGNMEQ
jgi:hypothetical protein